MILMSLHWTFRFIQVETVWVRDSYLIHSQMKPIKRLPKINSKTTKELKETTNDQSRIKADHEYQNKFSDTTRSYSRDR